MTSSNVRSIQTAPETSSVVPDSLHRQIRVRVRKVLSPRLARELAVELFYAADAAEGGSDAMSDFGYEPTDSEDFAELRSLIVEHIGWHDDDQELDQDYHARIRQVGEILRQKHVRLVR